MTLLSKKSLFRFLALGLASVIFIIGNHAIVAKKAKSNLFNNVDQISYNRVGLLLGTSKMLAGGYINPYYKYRIEATIELFKAHKITYVIVSGDNSRKEYSEPEDMQADLIEAGIPKENIFLDYAGFRTLDSVVRAKEIFGQTQLTCISQPFHNERALFISDKKGISMIGFNAKDPGGRNRTRMLYREYLARVKMLIDLYITKKGPKFLGDQIKIG